MLAIPGLHLEDGHSARDAGLVAAGFRKTLLVMGFFFGAIMPAGSQLAPSSTLPVRYLIAHRGGVVDAERPENSRSALDEAIRRGYTHVEIDARATADGRVVCFHDGSLQRAVGVDRLVSDLTLEELKTFRLSKSGEAIPTFDEFVSWCAGRIGVMVDLKPVSDQHMEAFAREVESVLKRHGVLEDSLILINKVPKTNQAEVAERLHGGARLSLRQPYSVVAAIAVADRLHRRFYIFNHGADFDEQEVEGFHALGLPVIVSINVGHYPPDQAIEQGRRDIERMLELGVDGLQIDSIYEGSWLRGSAAAPTSNPR